MIKMAMTQSKRFYLTKIQFHQLAISSYTLKIHPEVEKE